MLAQVYLIMVQASLLIISFHDAIQYIPVGAAPSSVMLIIHDFFSTPPRPDRPLAPPEDRDSIGADRFA